MSAMATIAAVARRPLALFERVMYRDGRDPVNVMLTARLRGRLDESRLRAALARLQGRHPVLRCLILSEQGRPHFVEQVTPPPIPLRILARHDDGDWIEASRREAQWLFDGSREPLCRLIWLRGDRDSELLLVCHHAICDGRSLLNLLDQLLRLHAEPHAELGASGTLVSIESVFPAEVLADHALRRRIRWRVALLKTALRLLPISQRRRRYGEAYWHFWKLDLVPSQHLLDRCKAEAVSPVAAFTAAFMLAFAAVREGRGIKKFMLTVDVRRFLPAIDPDGLFAVAPWVSLAALKDAGDEPSAPAFWALAWAIKADINGQIEGLSREVYTKFLGMERLHDVYPRMFAYNQSKHAEPHVSLGYMGRVAIATCHGELELRGVVGISAMLAPTPANLIVMSSFAGCFDFSFASDEVSLPRVAALAIVERAMATLQTCCAQVASEAAPFDAGVPRVARKESL